MTHDDHPPDTDDDDIGEDPDALALIDRIAHVLVDAAHEFAESTDDPITHPSWDELGELERNLFRAGVIVLAEHHRTRVAQVSASARPPD